MKLTPISAGLLLGFVVGGASRWLSIDDVPRSRESTVAIQSDGSLSPTMSINDPSRSKAKAQVSASPVTINEVLQARGDTFLTNLIVFVTSAQPTELEGLLTALIDQRRLDILAKDLIFMRWMEIDPAGGLAAARRHHQLSSAWWSWAKVDAGEALAAARAEGDSAAMAAVVRAIGQSDPEQAMNLINEVPPRSRGSAWEGILDAIAEEDPMRAAVMSVDLDQVNTVRVQDWMRNAPDIAFPWLAANLDPQSHAFTQMFQGLLQSHPERLPKLLADLPEGSAKTTCTINYAVYQSDHDLEAALTFLQSQTAGVRDDALGTIAERFVQSDSDAALKVLGKVDWENPPPNIHGVQVSLPGGSSESSGAEVSQAALRAVADLVANDPMRAAPFLESLPQSERSRSAYGQAMSRWMEVDSMAASNWLAQLPAGVLKDTAIVSMNSELTKGDDADFDAATRWSLTISDAAVMRGQLQSVFHRWSRSDPEGLRAGLEIPGLPESIVAQFQREDEQNPR